MAKPATFINLIGGGDGDSEPIAFWQIGPMWGTTKCARLCPTFSLTVRLILEVNRDENVIDMVAK
jgi:hypothetical protein